jgi:hypothetical protein
VEIYRVVRCRGSHIAYTTGSKMAVRLSASRTGRAVPRRNIIFLLLVLISVTDWVNPWTKCGWRDYVNWKKKIHPHHWVQTGLIIPLYMIILFSRDSCDLLFLSQFIFLTLSSNYLLLAFICVCNVSVLSRWSPRYLTSCLIGMEKLLTLTCGQIVLLVVN